VDTNGQTETFTQTGHRLNTAELHLNGDKCLNKKLMLEC